MAETTADAAQQIVDDAAAAPSKITSSSGSVEERSLEELQEWADKKKASAAVGGTSRGLRFNQITHKGTQG